MELGSLFDLVTTWGLKVLGGIAVLVVGIIVARVARKGTQMGLSHSGLDESLIEIIAGLVYYMLIAVIMIAVFGVVGIETASLITILGASSLAIGLALQGSLANFASGIMLFLFKPYRLHEYIEVGDYAGHVDRFGVFSTTLTTLDNVSIIVPNRYISDHPIRNWSVNGTRRVDLEIEIDINADLEKAGQAMLAMLEQDERILKDPAPVVAVSDYGDTAARFIVRPWCQHDHYWEVRYSLPEKLKAAVEAAGFAMPTPQRDIQLINPVNSQ